MASRYRRGGLTPSRLLSALLGQRGAAPPRVLDFLLDHGHLWVVQVRIFREPLPVEYDSATAPNLGRLEPRQIARRPQNRLPYRTPPHPELQNHHQTRKTTHRRNTHHQQFEGFGKSGNNQP